MIIVTGSVTARPEFATELQTAALAHVRRSRAEDGCISHSVQCDCENALRFVFFERWRDMAALKEHFRVPESVAFVRAIEAMASSVEPIAVYEAQEAA